MPRPAFVAAAGPFAAAAAPSPGLCVSVIVPVRNEAGGIHRTLRALAAQTTPDGAALGWHRYEILVLANNCSDATTAAVAAFARVHPGLGLLIADITLPEKLAHVGHARRVLMDAACDRLRRAGAAHGVIASTDGDTVVAPTWLFETLAEIDAGADAVGGRILTAFGGAFGSGGSGSSSRADGAAGGVVGDVAAADLAPDSGHESDAGTARWLRLDAAHRLAREKLVCRLDPDPADPWPRHHQHFCASLAVRAAAYAQVGGVPNVRYLEDEALVAALRRADLRVRHSPRVRVLTSGRRDGRVEVGLSWQLREWARSRRTAATLMVDDAHELVAHTHAVRRLRALWQRPPATGSSGACASEFAALARGWGVAGGWLAEATADAPTFGALRADIEARRTPARPRPQVPVRQAIDELHALIRAHAAAGAGADPGTGRGTEPGADVGAVPELQPGAAATSVRANTSSR